VGNHVFVKFMNYFLLFYALWLYMRELSILDGFRGDDQRYMCIINVGGLTIMSNISILAFLLNALHFLRQWFD